MTSKSVSLQEALENENKKLRAKLEKLEKEHKDLKRVYFELSIRQGNCGTGVNSDRAKETKDGASNGDLDGDVRNMYTQDRVPMTGPEESSTPDAKSFEDGRLLSAQHDLVGHTGAVYCIKYNRKGNLLASGGFDKSVRVWNVDNMSDKSAQHCFNEHSMYVSDIAWTIDGILASGSYDKTVKVFDVGSSQVAGSYEVEGFVLSLAASSWQPNTLLVGTSQRQLHLIDLRSARTAARMINDSMVLDTPPHHTYTTHR